MTDEELIKTLWSGEVTLGVVASAADRIEQLVKERDDAEWVEVLRRTYQRAKEAEAKLAKAGIAALETILDERGPVFDAMVEAAEDADLKHVSFNVVVSRAIRAALDELEKTNG